MPKPIRVPAATSPMSIPTPIPMNNPAVMRYFGPTLCFMVRFCFLDI